jgi:hypothetical protein
MPQHDMVIANGSGAAVRADINDALAAIGSMMKGPNAPPAPVSGMIWLDDDTPSATVWTVRQYDGAEWIEWGRLDITNNVFIPSEGVIAWADVASAATVDLGAQASRSLRLTGATAISSFGTAASGLRRRLRIATGLTITHNPSNIICPGAANLLLLAGDVLDVESLGGGVWVVVDLQPSAGYVGAGLITGSGLTTETAGLLGRIAAGTGPIQRIPLGNTAAALSLGINRATEQVVSGTPVNVDFLNIPAGVRQVIVGLSNVGTNGTSPIIVQLGSGSFLTSGYRAFANRVGPTAVNGVNLSAGIAGVNHFNAADTIDGLIILSATTNLRWASTGAGMMGPNSDCNFLTGGGVTLSGTLDRLRITTVIGSQTFDNGCIFNISWSF